MQDEPAEARLLAVGDGPDCSFVFACRDEGNRDYIDRTLLPSTVDIVSKGDPVLPQHPALLIRSYENVQMVLEPETIRLMAHWLLAAAEWLETTLEGD